MTLSTIELCQAASDTAPALANLTTTQKRSALTRMADHLRQATNELISINQAEVSQAEQRGISGALLDRLSLTEDRITAMADGIDTIAASPDPVGRELASWTVPSGLHIRRVAIPLGVIAIIYEARPNVTADAAALCFYSGNAVILRGGSECVNTNRAIADCLQRALAAENLPSTAIQMISNQAHHEVDVLLQQHELIDVLIPRGGEKLIRRVTEHSRIPVFSHLQGLCHTYVHEAADLEMATNVILNAKMRRVGICGATETVLLDQRIAPALVPTLTDQLITAGCCVRGDAAAQALDARIDAATELDWATEYLDAIVAIRIVTGLTEAIEHVNRYASDHTEAIITADPDAAARFMQHVNSAIVMHNCSTQFADGGEFGMGAEIGIATGKLHARGPVGTEQLTTFKYLVSGEGHTRP